MKRGRAIMVEPLVLFHTILERIAHGLAGVKSVSPTIPTMKREIPIQIVVPRKKGQTQKHHRRNYQ
jgi:hypothetical protein